jgi:hypothetical protein
MKKLIIAILLIPSLLFAGQGMGPGPGFKTYAPAGVTDFSDFQPGQDGWVDASTDPGVGITFFTSGGPNGHGYVRSEYFVNSEYTDDAGLLEKTINVLSGSTLSIVAKGNGGALTISWLGPGTSTEIATLLTSTYTQYTITAPSGVTGVNFFSNPAEGSWAEYSDITIEVAP